MHVDWILSGDRVKASSRLQGFAIHEWLRRQGHDSTIICINAADILVAPSRPFFDVARSLAASDAETVVFEGPEWVMVQLAQLCSCWGKKVIGVRCDFLRGLYDQFFDAMIVPTAGLADALEIKHAIVIEDMVEVPVDAFKADYRTHGKARVGWIGHQGYEPFVVPFVEDLRRCLDKQVDFELISAGGFATKQWSEATIVQDVLAWDIAILPIPQRDWFANKSTNRLAMMMALGMPIIASPIASYRQLGEHEKTVLFADLNSFADAIRQLLDEGRRAALGIAARLAVAGRFSPDAIASQWLEAISNAPRRVKHGWKAQATAACVRIAAALAPTQEPLIK